MTYPFANKYPHFQMYRNVFPIYSHFILRHKPFLLMYLNIEHQFISPGS